MKEDMLIDDIKILIWGKDDWVMIEDKSKADWY